MRKYIRLVSFLGDIPWETAGKVLLAQLITAAGFIQAFCLAWGVTAVFDGRWSSVLLYLTVCLAALLIRALLVRYQEGYTKKMAAKVKAVIRNRMLEKLMQLGPAYRNDKRTGNLQSLITDGVESFEPFLVQYLPQTIVVLITTVFSSAYLWKLDRAVGAVIIIMAVLAIIIPHLFMPAVSRVMIEYWQEYAALNAQYIDSMQGMSTLKSLGVSRREGKKLAGQAKKFAGESMKNLGISLSDSAVIVACTAIGTAASIAIAASHMAAGQISYENMLIILFLAGECMKPLNEMNTYWHSSYLGLSVAEELFQVLDEPVVILDGSGPDYLDNKLPDILLDHVSFCYEKDSAEVLNQVTMEIDAGKVTAIVGKSGSGKSTIVNLILRFFDVDQGKICLDGKDIRNFSVDFLRSQIAVVFQETYLFYGTIGENIKMGRPEATDEEMMNAAVLANAHEFIMNLPQGYQTVVGERGATLSGGERQRISIARAILKDAPILILDEATSSVDILHENLIQEALKRCMENKTTVVIAHRLSTIEQADRIYVLDHGKIDGWGTHEELMQRNFTYQGLIKAQNYAKQ